MRTIAITLFMLLLMAGSALAEVSDEDYVDSYFGTKLLVLTDSRPYDYDAGEWWGSFLPEQITNYENSYIAGIINAGRLAKGDPELLEVGSNFVALGYEQEIGGRFQYDISFRGVRPSEVAMLLKAMSLPETLISGASVEWEPLTYADFGYYGSMADDPIMVNIGGQSFELVLDMSSTELHERLMNIFREAYGREVNLDLYYSQNVTQYGNSCDLTISATIVEEGSGNAPAL